jgi:hypothetical protein
MGRGYERIIWIEAILISKQPNVYLHVAKQKLINIISPLDDLVEKEGIEW